MKATGHVAARRAVRGPVPPGHVVHEHLPHQRQRMGDAHRPRQDEGAATSDGASSPRLASDEIGRSEKMSKVIAKRNTVDPETSSAATAPKPRAGSCCRIRRRERRDLDRECVQGSWRFMQRNLAAGVEAADVAKPPMRRGRGCSARTRLICARQPPCAWQMCRRTSSGCAFNVCVAPSSTRYSTPSKASLGSIEMSQRAYAVVGGDRLLVRSSTHDAAPAEQCWTMWPHDAGGRRAVDGVLGPTCWWRNRHHSRPT